MGTDLAGHLDTFVLCAADHFDLFLAADVADMDGAPGQVRRQDGRGHSTPFGVTEQRAVMRPIFGVRHQRGQIIHAQRAKGLVEVHLQAGHLGGKGSGSGNILHAGSQVNAVVTARLLASEPLLQGQRLGIHHRGRVVGHIQHTGKAASQRGLRA